MSQYLARKTFPDDDALGTAVYTYDVDGRLETITTYRGTKTFTYDVDGKLTAIAGTGAYRSKTFTYSGDDLTDISIT